MKNGILEKNDKFQPYINSDNIEIYGMSLTDYIEKIKSNLLEQISTSFSYAFALHGNDLNIVNANTNYNPKFTYTYNVTNCDVFELKSDENENNYIEVVKTIPTQLNLCTIIFNCETNNSGNNTDANVIVRINVKRGNEEFNTIGVNEVFTLANHKANLTAMYSLLLNKGDKIYFDIQSNNPIKVTRNNVLVQLLNRVNSNILNYPI